MSQKPPGSNLVSAAYSLGGYRQHSGSIQTTNHDLFVERNLISAATTNLSL